MLENSRLAERGNLKLKVLIGKTPHRFRKIAGKLSVQCTPKAMIVSVPLCSDFV